MRGALLESRFYDQRDGGPFTPHGRFAPPSPTLPEAYEKFQWGFHYSFWLTTNWIKQVLEENLRVFTSAH